jgi:serine protease
MLNPRALLAAITLALVCGAPSHGQAPEAAPQENARVIVKFKSGVASSLQPSQFQSRALAASRGTAAQAASLGRRAGVSFAGGHLIAERTQVVTARGMDSAALARKLSEDSDVEYAVPDQWRYPHAAPNDPRYASGLGAPGPAAGQWYLRPQAGPLRSAIDAESAWDVTTGSPGVVVAVLDTGIRYDHPELLPVASGGNFLPGYDMVADAKVANDGDTGPTGNDNDRDDDASDPGDWLTPAEVAPGGDFATCGGEAGPSSWHGTQTSGLVAATTNNATGMASVGRNVQVLPVRVLGKCGGRDSDIIAGMRWAAGLHVDGVPDNTAHPAKIINLSLGGDGACSQAYVDAIRDVTAAGALVVVSAGNLGVAVSAPANCRGVVAVGSLQHTGAKVGFSDLGPEVTISAPGGNCVNDIGECLYPILTTTNNGLTTPAGADYTNASNVSVGTSFSAPLVSGTAALMLSVRPGLTPQQLKLLLQSTARAFPTFGAANGVQKCTSPQYDSTGAAVPQLQCYCSTGTCGAGMLDAGAAVRAAQAGTAVPVHARIDLFPLQPSAGAALRLSAANTELDAGRHIVNYQWDLVDGGGIVSGITGSNTGNATVTPSAAGKFSVRLTVVDSENTSSSVDLVVAVGPALPPAPSSGGGGGVSGAGWALAQLLGSLAQAFVRPARRP